MLIIAIDREKKNVIQNSIFSTDKQTSVLKPRSDSQLIVLIASDKNILKKITKERFQVRINDDITSNMSIFSRINLFRL